MGTINEKIMYLDETKQNLKNIFNMTNANITAETPFKDYSNKLYNGYLNVINDNTILYNNMPKETSLNGQTVNAAELPLYECKMTKVSTQITTLGYNLFDISTADYAYRCSLNNNIYTSATESVGNRNMVFGYRANNNYTAEAGETYYISMDIRLISGTASNIVNIRFDANFTNSAILNPTLTNQFQRYAFSVKNNTENSITTGRILIQPSNTNLNDAIFEVKNIVISKSNETAYEPYSNGFPSPSPKYSQPISTIMDNITLELVAENAFNKNTALSKKMINKDTGYPDSEPNTTCSDFIYVKGASLITLNGTSISYSNGGAFYDSYKNYTSGFSSSSLKNGLSIPTEACYIRFNLLPEDINTTVLTKTTSITIPLGNNEIAGIGDNKDELIIDVTGHCYLNKKTITYILDENKTIGILGSGTASYRYNTYVTEALIERSSNTFPNLSTHYKRAAISSGDTYQGYRNYNSGELLIRYGEEQSIEDYKSWLENNPVKFIFARQNSELIDLNYTIDNLVLSEGTNIITNNKNLDMEIKYIKNNYTQDS